jgi:hypothetical protein
MNVKAAELLASVGAEAERSESVQIMRNFPAGTENSAVCGNASQMRVALVRATLVLSDEGGTERWGISPEEFCNEVAIFRSGMMSGWAGIIWY